MLLWVLSGVVFLLIPIEAADEDDVKAGMMISSLWNPAVRNRLLWVT